MTDAGHWAITKAHNEHFVLRRAKNYAPFSIYSMKHPTAEHWHLHVVVFLNNHYKKFLAHCQTISSFNNPQNKALWEKNMLVPACSPFPTMFLPKAISSILPFSRQQMLDSSKLKEFADDNFKFDGILSNWLENHWEKEKLLVTSNFSFPHSVFTRLVLHTCKNQGLFGNELRHI